MSEEIVVARKSGELSANRRLTELTVDEMIRVANGFAQSGLFKASGKAMGLQEVFVAIMLGQEMGLGPASSVMGIHVIEGRPELSTNLQASLLKASGRYDYDVKFREDENGNTSECRIQFVELLAGERKVLGVSAFSMADAERAGLTKPTRNGKPSNYILYPRNMLFSRAMSNGIGWFAPDSTLVRVYHEGEIGGESDAPVLETPKDPAPKPAEPEVVEGTATEVTEQPPLPQQPQTPPQPPVPREGDDPSAPIFQQPSEPMSDAHDEVTGEMRPGESAVEAMARMEREEALPDFDPATEPPPAVVEPPPTVEHHEGEDTINGNQIRLLWVLVKQAGFTDDRRHEVFAEVTGTPHIDRIPASKMNLIVRRLNAEIEAMTAPDPSE